MQHIAMVKVKNTRNEIQSGLFQNTSNWHTIPVNISIKVVTAENTIPTTAQLTQYAEWPTPTT
jgi:glutaredoxin-related protein